jgi:hypothetical protein
MANIPNGWTDDMTVSLRSGQTVAQVVSFVIDRILTKNPDPDLGVALASSFGLSPDDTELVCDRVFGGVYRAATGNAANRPDATKDPFAFTAYERASREPKIIPAFFPDYVCPPKRAWWQFWTR